MVPCVRKSQNRVFIWRKFEALLPKIIRVRNASDFNQINFPAGDSLFISDF